jgi:hypothetical protein
MVVCPSKSDRGFNLQDIFSMSLTVIALTRDVSQDMFPSFEIFIGLFSLAAKRKNYNKEMMGTEYVSGSQFLTACSLLTLS